MLLHEIHFSAISFFCVVAQDNLTKTDQYLLKTNWCVGAKIILNRFLLFWLQRLGRSENFSRQIFFSLINSDFKISYTFVSLIVGWKRSFLFTSNTLKPYNWLKEYYILCELLSSATTTWNGLYIMVIELSGVQFGLKSYAWFQNWTSAQCEFNLKSQVWFQTKIARHEVQLPLYYIHFEIAQIQDLNSSIFWEEKIRVLETKVAKFATWSFMSFIFLQFDWLLKTSLEVWLVVLFLV